MWLWLEGRKCIANLGCILGKPQKPTALNDCINAGASEEFLEAN